MNPHTPYFITFFLQRRITGATEVTEDSAVILSRFNHKDIQPLYKHTVGYANITNTMTPDL